MQRNIFVVMLFVMIILPIMMLFANDSVFFVIIAFIIFIFSIKNLYRVVLRHDPEDDDNDGDGKENEDLARLSGYTEDIPEIDMERFELLAKLVRNLIVLLFYIYCMFQFDSLVAKAFIILIFMYWLYFTVNDTDTRLPAAGDENVRSLSNVFYLVINLSTVVIIILTACNKFIRKVL